MRADDVRRRITELRLKKGVSEYQMSYDLGHSKSYVNNITSGKSLPSLPEMFSICDYFDIGIVDFFSESDPPTMRIRKIVEGLRDMSEADQELVLQMVKRLRDQ
ncbi:MAG: helix-turn-helix transcriptional regulator [Clostridia bacterium]|nr:helix-turn-helix transcriptional regulator [Clostridia bacterium]